MAARFPDDELQWRKKLLHHEIRCDTALESNTGAKVPCHWHVLCERSEFFQLMYCSDFRETQPGNSIKIGLDIDAGLLRNIVQFLYTGELDLDDGNSFFVLQFSHMYQIKHLHERAEQFFMKCIENTRQPAQLLESISVYLSPEKVAQIEDKLVEKLVKLHSGSWMKSAAFLCLSARAVTSLLSRPELHCNDETHLFNAVIIWWKHKEDEREASLKQVLSQALNAVDLPTVRVKDIVASQELEETHPLTQFANSLPIESMTSLRPVRTNTERIDCFVLHLREYGDVNQVWLLLIKVRAGEIQRFRKLDVFSDANEVADVAGLTFVQKLPTLQYEQVKKPHVQKLKGDFVLDLNLRNSRSENKLLSERRKFLLVKFKEDDSTKDLLLTVYEPHSTLYKKIREGKVTIPKARDAEDEHILHVHKQHLFAIHAYKHSVLVYDICEMKVKGKVYIRTTERWFPAAAQLLNIIVFVSIKENYLFDLDSIAAAARDTGAEYTPPLAPLARFEQPVKFDDNTNFSAEVLGDRFFLMIVERGRLLSFSCDLAAILRCGGSEKVKWTEQAVMLPYDALKDSKLKWIDLQRRRVGRREQKWEEFRFVDMDSWLAQKDEDSSDDSTDSDYEGGED